VSRWRVIYLLLLVFLGLLHNHVMQWATLGSMNLPFSVKTAVVPWLVRWTPITGEWRILSRYNISSWQKLSLRYTWCMLWTCTIHYFVILSSLAFTSLAHEGFSWSQDTNRVLVFVLWTFLWILYDLVHCLMFLSAFLKLLLTNSNRVDLILITY
jgi:hypothetical protein